MSLFNIFDVAGTALNAQSVRLNTTASNLANAESISGDAATTYRARHPVFQSLVGAADDSSMVADDDQESVGVRVLGVVESQAPAQMHYEPGHPLANKDGYIFSSNVNAIEEMTNMISASRSFSTNIDAMNTARDLLLKTISMGH
jgi:flagellar basal-body rod protein FlgC